MNSEPTGTGRMHYKSASAHAVVNTDSRCAANSRSGKVSTRSFASVKHLLSARVAITHTTTIVMSVDLTSTHVRSLPKHQSLLSGFPDGAVTQYSN